MHVYKSKCIKTDKKYDNNCLAKHAEIAVRQPKPYAFSVTVDGKTKEKDLMFPQHGSLYTLPLPTGTLFGTNDAKIVFNIDGTVNTITYNTTSDLDGVTKAIDKFKGDSDTEKAQNSTAEAKAKADSIYQQNRLKFCENDPEKCKPK